MRAIYKIGLVLISVSMASCQSSTKKNTEYKETIGIESSAEVEAPTIDLELYFQSALDGNIGPVEEAIKQGVDIEVRDQNNYTALMLAAYNGHHHIIKLLLDKGAQIDAKENLNRTALMFASTGPFVQAVELLIQSGAEVNAFDNHENWTPVMFAAGEGQLEVVKLLIANGADLSMLDTDGESSLDFAKSKGHTEVAAYLQTQMK
ncbi:ankyrin repeat domain-containing protein [Carboxylicivirga sp. M1479]|uniref:ankyrin repeat domain-containing protein n=1 Tax=Carboxylicivirga sp. M1479 TaxID=2594476 RepID=UPI001177CE68|nr:ankyrin repeat domain-containing protein [Carboxylicivirga sp. M1479]TRX71629.1 ankyrin repeat domain-containing protein [Carboxylicivirga sp. M1479]